MYKFKGNLKSAKQEEESIYQKYIRFGVDDAISEEKIENQTHRDTVHIEENTQDYVSMW